jgi:RluA family pseudouridine synthase
LLRKGAVRLNGRKAKGEARLEPDDKILVDVPSEDLRQAPPDRAAGGGFRGRIEVLFEDDDLLVLDKPAGMAVHPGTGTPPGTTVIERVWQELGVSNSVFQPALAHRLDRGTSGVLVVAKTRKALLDIQRQIQSKDTPKEYIALVEGVPAKNSGVIKERLTRVDSRDRGAKSVVAKAGEEGLDSETRWKLRTRFGEYALVDVQILSGRLHQIRAHMASIGHPVAGDDRYGTVKFAGLKRPFLHAARLGLKLYGRNVFFESPLPSDLGAVVKRLEVRK